MLSSERHQRCASYVVRARSLPRHSHHVYSCLVLILFLSCDAAIPCKFVGVLWVPRLILSLLFSMYAFFAAAVGVFQNDRKGFWLTQLVVNN
jgi:hypothetical protein